MSAERESCGSNTTPPRRADRFGCPQLEQAIAELLGRPGLLAAAYTIVQIFGIVAAVHAVFNARSAQGATAWAIALIAAPVVALPFYVAFGRNRFKAADEFIGRVQALFNAGADREVFLTEFTFSTN